jgi:hypothetical protein
VTDQTQTPQLTLPLETVPPPFVPFEIFGLKGMKRTAFRKAFRTERAWDKWSDRNDETGDVEILSYSDLD